LAALLLATFGVAILAASALAASGNLVKNGSFEKDSNGDGIPNSWNPGGLTPADKRVCNQSYAGMCSFKMIADGGNKTFYTQIAVSGLAGDEFNLSAWTKGKNIVYGAGVTQVVVLFYHTGGGSSESLFDIPEGNSPWTLRQFSGATAAADYNTIVITLRVTAGSGKMWLDKVKLVPAP
jgi:hypothetical protein